MSAAVFARLVAGEECNECGTELGPGEVAEWWPWQAMEDGEPSALPVCASCVEANR